MRTNDRVIRDLLYRRDEHLRRDIEFPALRGSRALPSSGPCSEASADRRGILAAQRKAVASGDEMLVGAAKEDSTGTADDECCRNLTAVRQSRISRVGAFWVSSKRERDLSARAGACSITRATAPGCMLAIGKHPRDPTIGAGVAPEFVPTRNSGLIGSRGGGTRRRGASRDLATRSCAAHMSVEARFRSWRGHLPVQLG